MASEHSDEVLNLMYDTFRFANLHDQIQSSHSSTEYGHVAMSTHSPIDVRVVVSDLVVSLSASLFIDLGCHFSGGQE